MAEALGAFDIGSGSIKLTVAFVGASKIDVVFSEQIQVLVAQSVLQSGGKMIGEDVAQQMQDTIRLLISKGKESLLVDQNIQYSGVATAVYRETDNGMQIIRSLADYFKFKIDVITQQTEGYLGFLTAWQGSGGSHQPIISWDTGGASFQLAAIPTELSIENMKIFKGPLGSSKVTAIMVGLQGKDFSQTQSANPATMEDCKALLEHLTEILKKEPMPDWILESKRVIGIGGKTCAMQMAKTLLNTSSFSHTDIMNALVKVLDKTDDELSSYPQPQMLIPKLVLLITIIRHFNMAAVEYIPSNGSTTGMFLKKDLWK